MGVCKKNLCFIYMDKDGFKELVLGLLTWIFGWTLFDHFMALYKFQLKTKFYICLVGFVITLCLFYGELDDNDEKK